jgi:RNA polymerase sigma-70 factor (ECF subfamily)
MQEPDGFWARPRPGGAVLSTLRGANQVDRLTVIEPVGDGDGDADLVAAAQAGDRGALERLLRRHHDRLHNVCRRVTGTDADAADATQECLIAIVRGLARYDGRASFSTWTYRIAVNASLDELRRRRRRPLAVLDEGWHLDGARRGDAGSARGSSPGGMVADGADPVADRLDIDAALGQLPEDFRAAVVLRDLSGLSYQEIAEVLDVPIGTVRSRIARGRSALADLLSPVAATRPDGGGGA